MRENIALVLSVAVFATLIISISVRSRRRSLKIQSASCLLEALYSFTIGALTGAFINVINFIRSGLFVRRDEFGRFSYLLILVFFDLVILGNCLLTWAGPVSLLPTIGSLVRTYCLWQSDMRLIRVSGAGVYEIVSKDVLRRRKNVAKRAAAYHRRLCYQEADSR